MSLVSIVKCHTGAWIRHLRTTSHWNIILYVPVCVNHFFIFLCFLITTLSRFKCISKLVPFSRLHTYHPILRQEDISTWKRYGSTFDSEVIGIFHINFEQNILSIKNRVRFWKGDKKCKKRSITVRASLSEAFAQYTPPCSFLFPRTAGQADVPARLFDST